MKITKEFSEKVLQLWDGWELRVMVCLSLVLQITLVMLGSRRKYIARSWIRFLVWSAYLLADLVATTTLGILARNQGYSDTCWEKLNHSIQAFWAPFLLLHLGGPDTITAYSIQDNELWLRHLLGLVIQLIFALYVFVMAWNGTTLTFLSIPMFITGITKYGERTLSLKSSTNSDIKNILHGVRPQQDNKSTKVVPREDVQGVKHPLHQAYYLFRMSIFHFEDLVLGPSELNDSHSLISGKEPEEAFELVEMELGFIYDIFFTKAITTFTALGIFLRLFSFICSITTLVSFFMFVDKQPYSIIDVDITYLLLWGAILLEVYAFLCLFFSDWTMVWHFLVQSQERSIVRSEERPVVPSPVVPSQEKPVVPSQEQPNSNRIYDLHEYFTKGKRWCGSTAQFSLIRSCLKIKKCPKFLEKMIRHVYTGWRAPSDEMKKMIFHQLLEKGERVIKRLDDAQLRKLVEQRGDGVLDRMQQPADERLAAIRSFVELEFNHSLLIWHIATDLCYNAELQNANDNAEMLSLDCKTSKQLSDYMMYLLVMRPSMLPKGIGHDKETRYRDVCGEMRTFFREMKKKSSDEKNVCLALLGLMEDSVKKSNAGSQEYRVAVTINSEKNLRTNQLVDGCKLAKKLQEFDEEKMWEMICKIWIEMLGYAAIHCEWKEHAEGLGRGGELLTHVCVLMTHLGLSLQYQGPTEIEITGVGDAKSSPQASEIT